MVRPQQSRRRSKASGFSVLGERGNLVSERREAQVQHAEGEAMVGAAKSGSGDGERRLMGLYFCLYRYEASRVRVVATLFAGRGLEYTGRSS
jgi:hypothetical protein